MKKRDFIKLGLDEELALKCEQASSEELTNYVPKNQYDEVLVDKKQAQFELIERDKQLTDLKNSTGDIDELKKTIDTLQADNKLKEENHAKEVHKLKLDTAIDTALRNCNAINPKTVLPLLEGLDKAKFEDDGSIKGLSEQLEKLTTGEDTSFLFKQATTPTFKGANIGESGNDEGEQSINNTSSYENIAKMLEQNPNALGGD